jgi:hypothetical protein
MQTQQTVQLVPARYVVIRLASQLTGYTPGAIRTKIKRGVWNEGQVWRYGPDGRVLIDMQGYARWVVNR